MLSRILRQIKGHRSFWLSYNTVLCTQNFFHTGPSKESVLASCIETNQRGEAMILNQSLGSDRTRTRAEISQISSFHIEQRWTIKGTTNESTSSPKLEQSATTKCMTCNLISTTSTAARETLSAATPSLRQLQPRLKLSSC